MSKDQCKQRFKGVENFLRRVAFNLGNTPSQTEVKVISCIPIDVSDLQQKIIELEKQLEAVNCKAVSKSQIEINTAICSTSFPKFCNVPNTCKTVSCHQSNASLPCPNFCINSKSSKTYSTCPAGPCQTHDCFSTDATEMSCSKKRKQNEGRKKFFTKKTVPKAKKMRTQFVYYAETENRNPFNRHDLPDTVIKNRSEDSKVFERSYLSNMVRKQYRPDAVNVDFGISEYSSPICRDFACAQNLLNHKPNESDMCSCCHGPFKNIDDHMKKQNHYDIYPSLTESNNSYYDSKFYDVIPVKENCNKIKNIEHPKRNEPKQLNKCKIDTVFWPGCKRPRYRDVPIIVNYNTTGSLRQHRQNPVKLLNMRRSDHNLKYKKPVVSAPVNRHVKSKVSKTRSVEFSEVYARKLEKGTRNIAHKRTPIRVTNQNDTGCLTTIIASTECQTTSSTNAQNHTITNITESEDRTKVTLNQIKDILQSVLTEVKTNSKIGNTCGQAKKKDATVQNGLSQNYMFGGSSLLQSFSYSPYEIDPYGPSCSQQIQTGSLYYPNVPPGPAKCMQNYPLIVQPRRNMCASCYDPTKNNPHKLPNMRRAASTATNTEELQGRSKETEILIREIYKAMALNINISENVPVKEHGYLNKTIHNNNIKSEDRETNIAANDVSELFKNTNLIQTSVTQNTGTPFDSKLASNYISFRSNPQRNSERDKNSKHDNNEVRSEYDEAEPVSRQPESDEESDTTIVNEEGTESESASEAETEYDEDNVVLAIEEPIKNKEKEGFLSKMLKIFTPRSRNRKYKSKNQSRDSESINYRIIDGNKAIPTSTLKPITSKSRAVIYYSKKPKIQRPQHLRKTPYMEQEYRRHFDEKLMFHDTQNPKSSWETDARNKPIFFQKIEARSALVDYDQNRTIRSTKQHVANQHQENYSQSQSPSPGRTIVPAKAQRWLKKHKLQCGRRWKKLILES